MQRRANPKGITRLRLEKDAVFIDGERGAGLRMRRNVRGGFVIAWRVEAHKRKESREQTVQRLVHVCGSAGCGFFISNNGLLHPDTSSGNPPMHREYSDVDQGDDERFDQGLRTAAPFFFQGG